MNFDYGIATIGRAFSGAATALVFKRKRPEADLNHRKISQVDRKVGEIDRGGKQLLHDAHVRSDPLSQASCVGDQRCPRSRILPSEAW
jgi:hypothetical protein